MNGGSLFTPKKNIYIVKYGTEKDPELWRARPEKHRGLYAAVYTPSRHLPHSCPLHPPTPTTKDFTSLPRWALSSEVAWVPHENPMGLCDTRGRPLSPTFQTLFVLANERSQAALLPGPRAGESTRMQHLRPQPHGTRAPGRQHLRRPGVMGPSALLWPQELLRGPADINACPVIFSQPAGLPPPGQRGLEGSKSGHGLLCF